MNEKLQHRFLKKVRIWSANTFVADSSSFIKICLFSELNEILIDLNLLVLIIYKITVHVRMVDSHRKQFRIYIRESELKVSKLILKPIWTIYILTENEKQKKKKTKCI